MPNRSPQPGCLQPVICSYGLDLRLPPPAHNGRLNAPRCLRRRWKASVMLLAVSCKCYKPTFQSDDCFCRPDANPRPFATSIARVIRVFEGRSGSRIFSAVSAPATGNVLS